MNIDNQLSLAPRSKPAEHAHCLRIMTYNIHSCIGTDGIASTTRIAKVIARYQPDIVALQEVDLEQAKTDHDDQGALLASAVSMDIHFQAVRHLQYGRFGNAILTSLPMERIHAGALSTPKTNKKKLQHLPFNQPRGALWVRVKFAGKWINLITTHLGLTPLERKEQVNSLLSESWLGSSRCRGAVVLCGDFNATHRQAAIKRLSVHLANAQTTLFGKAVKKTFPSRYPGICIDHVMTDPSLKALAVMVDDSDLGKVASDHLPLIVDLEFND